MERIRIVGAGLAGLSAALTLAKQKIPCSLISVQASERAQSALAEGGINAALDTMGEGDSPAQHMEDTLRSGAGLSDPEAVRALTEHAPEIVLAFADLGVPFAMTDKKIRLRSFGGQRKKRTAYAKSSTGKMLLSALIDEARKYETGDELICRYPHHSFLRLILNETGDRCRGVVVKDEYTGEVFPLYGPVILAFGGLNGMFPQNTTGTYANSAQAAANVFAQGVRFGNLEMIQYHPTTTRISGKIMLISEAARGEGGRLYVMRRGKPWYFMEEKYPELGNLMPRDVVSREMTFVCSDPDCEDQVYLDLRGIPSDSLRENIPDLCDEIRHYKNLDPETEPIPVNPGIHYFMGGIDVDVNHRTNIKNLYAAGECCDQYHGANRLGGNSTLGALYGGGVAACELEKEMRTVEDSDQDVASEPVAAPHEEASEGIILKIRDILLEAMGIVRTEEKLSRGLEKLEELEADGGLNQSEKNRILLAKAMVSSALIRRESRGAHYREDYPDPDPKQAKKILAYGSDGVTVTLGDQDDDRK